MHKVSKRRSENRSLKQENNSGFIFPPLRRIHKTSLKVSSPTTQPPASSHGVVSLCLNYTLWGKKCIIDT